MGYEILGTIVVMLVTAFVAIGTITIITRTRKRMMQYETKRAIKAARWRMVFDMTDLRKTATKAEVE